MKYRFIIPVLAAAIMASVSCANLNTTTLLQGGVQAAQAMTITDSDVRAYVAQYISQLDAQSTVLPENDAYTKRLRRITNGLKDVDGVPLNFKVYKTNDVNAFACADGSVRVYTGIMDVMTDNELLGVIGHEIGHVAMKHTKKEMRNSLLTSAALEGIASTSQTAATLTDSQLGAIGNAILNARYSRKQESEADDYGYAFLKAVGKNPWGMAMSFEKLQKVAGGTGAQASAAQKLFSSHPDTETRIKRMAERATAEGYKRPAK